jgi:hypothetical protein
MHVSSMNVSPPHRRRRDLRDVLRPAEDVDDVDRDRDRFEVGIDGLAEDRRVEGPRVDRDHPEALALEVAHHEVARSVPARRPPTIAIVRVSR